MTEPAVSEAMRAKLADWLNAFKADPFSTGADKVDRLIEVIGTQSATPPAADRQELVERVAFAVREIMNMQHGYLPHQIQSEEIAKAALEAALRLIEEKQ